MSKQWQTSNQQYGTHARRSASQPKTKVGRSTLELLEAQDPTRFLHEQEKIAQRERLGLFSQPVGLAPGDQYRDSRRTVTLTQPRRCPGAWRSTRACSSGWRPSCSRG